MQITVVFDSLEEFQKYVRQERSLTITENGVTFSEGGINCTSPVIDPSMIGKTVEVAAEEVKAEQKAPDPEPEPAKAEPEGPVLDENYRLKVRKTLASLNKMKSGNPAKSLIAETGYNRLTEVPLELLPGLLARAEEVMQDA